MSAIDGRLEFKLESELVFLEKENGIYISSLDLSEKIFKLNFLSAEIFTMAINGFSVAEIREVCHSTNVAKEGIDEHIDNLLTTLVAEKILIPSQPAA